MKNSAPSTSQNAQQYNSYKSIFIMRFHYDLVIGILKTQYYILDDNVTKGDFRKIFEKTKNHVCRTQVNFILINNMNPIFAEKTFL